MTKAEFRNLYLAKRKAIDPEIRRRWSAAIGDRLFESINFGSLKSVHTYLSVERNAEPNTDFIISRIRTEYPQISVYVPRVRIESGDIESVALDESGRLAQNRWGIPEPIQGRVADPETFDLVIVPLIYVDKSGHRVGYGKGFYDRFLRQCREDCLKAGLSFFPPNGAIEDVHLGDIKLDVCITPTSIYRFSQNPLISVNP